MNLLVASKSNTRRLMLEAAGVPFEIVDSRTDEEQVKADVMASGVNARTLAERLAAAKALGVGALPGMRILGADQVLETDTGAILGKAGSREQLRDQLRSLRGRVHHLHSAAVIVENGTPGWSACETATLAMRDLSDSFLDDYLAREYEVVRWNVGGYRIEGPGVQLFDQIEGSHFAILGLPLLPLLGFLRQQGMIGQ